MRWFLSLSIILATLSTAAQAADIAISMARNQWLPEERVEFTLVVANADREELLDHLVVRLDYNGHSRSVTARLLPDEGMSEAKNGDGKKLYRYAFDAPDGLTGTVVLHVTELSVPAVQFEIIVQAETPKAGHYPTLESLFTLYQPYLGNIGAYDPIYLLVGTDPSKSKFQVSFKYRFFNPESDFADRHTWVKGFHFGYTQTSFWDLESNSAPFEDTSYKPELFWISRNLVSGVSAVKGLFFQSGFQHESNGRGGDLSRSTNYLYVKPVFVFFSERNRYGLQIAPKIWTYINNDDDTNPDLADYRGYFDLEIKLGKADSFVLWSCLRWAEEGASVQLDLTYPLHRFLFNALDIYLHAQYTDALAESLIDYQDRTQAFRLGLSIVR